MQNLLYKIILWYHKRNRKCDTQCEIKTKQNKTKQIKTKQNKTREGKTRGRQNKTRQGREQVIDEAKTGIIVERECMEEKKGKG